MPTSIIISRLWTVSTKFTRIYLLGVQLGAKVLRPKPELSQLAKCQEDWFQEATPSIADSVQYLLISQAPQSWQTPFPQLQESEATRPQSESTLRTKVDQAQLLNQSSSHPAMVWVQPTSRKWCSRRVRMTTRISFFSKALAQRKRWATLLISLRVGRLFQKTKT